MRQGRSSVGSERLSHIQEVIGSTPIVPTHRRHTVLAVFVPGCPPVIPEPLCVIPDLIGDLLSSSSRA